jgi:CheY-like chemotaxis protein
MTPDKSTFTVLIMDDDALILDCLSELLKAEGYQIYTASSGAECIAIISNSIHPDIVITDYRMHNLYGVEVIKSIRKFLGKEIPAIIFTDDESIKVRDAVRLSQCIYLRRQHEFNTLINQVSKIFA